MDTQVAQENAERPDPPEREALRDLLDHQDHKECLAQEDCQESVDRMVSQDPRD